MNTLTPYVHKYVTGRRARGEITRSTAADYRWTLHGLVESYGERPLNLFGPAAIDRWLETVGHLADATRREYLSRVRKFCQWLVKEGKIRVDPTTHVGTIHQARRSPRVLTRAQVNELLASRPDARSKAIMWLMVGCGLRCCEVARLRVEDYDPVARTIVVTGKNNHERALPVPAQVAYWLDRYLEEVGIVAGSLIRSELNPVKGLSPKTLSGYLRAWMLAAGVKARPMDGRSAHALRRTAATEVADTGADLRVVQEMLGHERIETTARHYLAHVTLAQMREAMEARTYGDAA
jgi:integrase/recombinase XerC